MAYIAIAPANVNLTSEWLVEAFGGPATYIESRYSYGYFGPSWRVFVVTENRLYHGITGEFEKEEDAILFRLTWS